QTGQKIVRPALVANPPFQERKWREDAGSEVDIAHARLGGDAGEHAGARLGAETAVGLLCGQKTRGRLAGKVEIERIRAEIPKSHETRERISIAADRAARLEGPFHRHVHARE